jgi:hypothetical protein
MKKFSIILFLVLISAFGIRWYTYPNFRSIQKELTERFDTNLEGSDVNRDTYDEYVQLEAKNNMYFPLSTVKYAKLFSGILSMDKTLEENELKQVLTILNDTTSYRWGEIGTPVFNKHIVYYNKNHQVIGLTKFEEEMFQAYSIPYLGFMKWCRLKPEKVKIIKKIIY